MSHAYELIGQDDRTLKDVEGSSRLLPSTTRQTIEAGP